MPRGQLSSGLVGARHEQVEVRSVIVSPVTGSPFQPHVRWHFIATSENAQAPPKEKAKALIELGVANPPDANVI